MTTIATMADRDDAQGAAAPTADIQSPQVSAAGAKPGGASRSLLVPVLTTLVGTLVAGVFLLALAGFNVLRGDIGRMRGDIEQVRSDTTREINSLREEMTRGFGEINSVLLDHTDRLARIETHLGVGHSRDRPAAIRSSPPGRA